MVPSHGAAFVEARVIGRDVGMLALVAGGMFELHIGELGGHGIGRIHVAERGGEDDVAARQRHLRQHALGIGAFGHVFLIGGFHLVAISGLDGQHGPDRADRSSRHHRSGRHRRNRPSPCLAQRRLPPKARPKPKRGRGQKCSSFHCSTPVSGGHPAPVGIGP